ncbi:MULTISPECIES: ABC transporter permease subunit [unclassified Breznakia]|uniref:ABC transporter permease n=1 Tax=unclassified Breznakia TaxID=2623764 RepID=UPI0024073432|nr:MULTISPECIES: ABC transporter permease subunit [unclassified Breznakia]
MDNFIKSISIKYQAFFDAIKAAGIWIVNSINSILMMIPWWLFIILIVALTYYVTKKVRTSLLYGGLITLIGFFGLWSHMMETLSIVITSVAISLLLGFPLGVLIALSKKAEKIIRPILDMMQTMPTFVYLVPAVILFGVGKVPAIMATTIYSIVPMIRMTNHGISHVDKEVIEAARAFGSTTMQTLLKVQIPQSLSTIMTGMNQTLMMAMSMVVTCSLIGANGLGMEILVATNRTEMGKALLPGLAIVFLAIILDRLTQGIVKKSEKIYE